MRYLAASLSVSLLIPLGAAAQVVGDPQLVDITISGDGSAKGVWTLPYNITAALGQVLFPEPHEFGTSGGTHYKISSVLDEAKKPVVLTTTGEEEYGYQPPAGVSGVKNFYLSEDITPMFNGPVALYEFWSVDSSVASVAKTTVRAPRTWSVMTAWPRPATSTPGIIAWDRPTEYRAYLPLIVLFMTDRPGSVEKIGRYTIAGSAADVAQVRQAMALLPADTFMTTVLGITLPEQIYIVVDDLTKVDSLGYEVEALAVHPNIVIVNNRFEKNRTPEETAEVISHELAHIAMYKTNPFLGGLSYLRWLNEGVAVAYEDAAHKQIFADRAKRVVNEELGRTHSVSPLDAEALYADRFDYAMIGSRAQGTAGSYRHAGLTFARFGDVAGSKGFANLFDAISNTKLTYDQERDSKQVLAIMGRASGLTEKQLLYPGREENDIKGVVGRIGHADNESDADIATVVSYIKGVRHYFVGASSPVAPTATSSANTQATSSSSFVPITATLKLGSKGSQVRLLQAFLIERGLLAKGASKDAVFDKALQKAVISYQKSARIPATGTVGPATRAAINAAGGR